MIMKMKPSFSFSIILLVLLFAVLYLSCVLASRDSSLHGGRGSDHRSAEVMEDQIVFTVQDQDVDKDDDGKFSSSDEFVKLRPSSSPSDVRTKEQAVRDLFYMFQEWMSEHRKVWKSLEEMAARFDAFVDNHRYVEARNEQLKREGGGYRVGLNGFAHLTYEEFQRDYLQAGGYVDHVEGMRTKQQLIKQSGAGLMGSSFRYENVTDIPRNVDWRKKGALTWVKDQGQCGSCWAFSTVATIEAAHQIVTGKLVSLSEQELVDCDRAKNQGCNGGLMDYAFEFIVSNGGLDTEKDYPYSAHAGRCNLRKRNKHVVSIEGYEDVPESDEDALLKAVAHQPVSVAIDAEDRDFQLYHRGVFSGSCGKDLNHAVVVVGYGEEEDGKGYWIVRNSWGEDWGDSGYVKMARIGSKDPAGICGINMVPSYPIIHQHHIKPAKEPIDVVERYILPLLLGL